MTGLIYKIRTKKKVNHAENVYRFIWFCFHILSGLIVVHSKCPIVRLCAAYSSEPGANSADDKFTLFLFFQKTGFDISCKLSPLETICMKCQNLFSRKNNEIFQNVVCWKFYLGCKASSRKRAYIILTPLNPTFYIVKLEFRGVYIIFLILLKTWIAVLVRTASPRRF